MIRFGVLGPLDVRVEGRPLDLGGPRQRALLVALLVHRTVTADALVQMLWGEDAPATAAKALQVAVSRLRGALGPAAARVETVGGGYRLRIEPGDLDAQRFEHAVTHARGLTPAGAAPALAAALALWRGPALADVRYEPWAQGEIRRLEELRAVAIEERVEAELALGEHARLAGELEALVAEHPRRERLRAQQMLALYRSGRHVDALAAFRASRAALDEVGLAPGPALRTLEQQILTHEPSLAPAQQEFGPPAPPTPTFGRENDRRAVLDLLDRARLVTLTGPGGVGKTRLAIEVARATGSRFVSLASTAESERMPAVICDALGVARVHGENDLEALDRTLSRGPPRLVLDNLEHLPGAGALLAGLLERHRDLRVLATSRQPVRIQAERLFPVAPLGAADAVALFTDRAQARDPSFTATDAVATVCERVGGLPLAIELAAARLGLLTPEDLADRLTDALAVLGGGPQDAPARQRTLRATLDWSVDLLDDDERRGFIALGVFAGGCELDAAEAVTGCGLPVLEGLVAKSLVAAHGGRLSMLEPVRQYAAEQLAAQPDAEAVRARHFEHFLALAERTEDELWVRGRASPAFADVRREHANLEVAVEWALASRPVSALALLGALGSYPPLAHAEPQMARWCARALAAAGDRAPARLRGRALLAMHHSRSDTRDSGLAAAAVALFREAGTETDLIRALYSHSLVLAFDEEYEEALPLAQEALRRARDAGDTAAIGATLGGVALATPRIEEALPFVREAVPHLWAVDAPGRVARLLTTMGMVALGEDAYDHAERLEREALEAIRELDDPYALGLVHGNTGLAALLGGRRDAADAAFRAELAVARAHGYPGFAFEGLLGLAALAGAEGADERAAVLEAAAWALNDRPPYPSEMPVYDRVTDRFLAPARTRLGAEASERAAATGRAFSVDDALAYALEGRAVSALLPD